MRTPRPKPSLAWLAEAANFLHVVPPIVLVLGGEHRRQEAKGRGHSPPGQQLWPLQPRTSDRLSSPVVLMEHRRWNCAWKRAEASPKETTGLATWSLTTPSWSE